MNITYIIGNGFDLNLGLKTSYANFYEYYKSIGGDLLNLKNLKDDITQNFKNWSDLEIALGQYTEHLKTIEDVDEVFEDIGENLAKYLEKEEAKFEVASIEKEKIFQYLIHPELPLPRSDKDDLVNYKSKWSNNHWYVNLITLNYTRTLEKIIEVKPSFQVGVHHSNVPVHLRSLEHLHGFTDYRMVIGVNDISQVKNKAFHDKQDALEAIIKTNCNEAQKHAVDKICVQQIVAAHLVCIFGSSIGDTDNFWWQLVGDQLKRNDFRLIIFYKGEEVPRRVIYVLAP